MTEIISRYVGNLNTWAETYVLPLRDGDGKRHFKWHRGHRDGTVSFLSNTLIGVIAAIYMLVSKTCSPRRRKTDIQHIPRQDGECFSGKYAVCA